MMHLLRAHKSGLAGVAPRKGRQPRRLRFEEVIDSIEKGLAACSAREEKWGRPPRCIG